MVGQLEWAKERLRAAGCTFQGYEEHLRQEGTKNGPSKTKSFIQRHEDIV